MIDINFAVNRTDDAGITHRFTLFVQAADDGGVQAILCAQRWREIGVNRADNHDTGIEIGVFVQQIDLPVNKRPQEVTFTKLNNFVRVLTAREVTAI
jgi:hypothetical protein